MTNGFLNKKKRTEMEYRWFWVIWRCGHYRFPARINPERLRIFLSCKKQDPGHADMQHSARLISRVSIKICGFLTRSNPHTGAAIYVLFIHPFSSRASLSRISYSIAKLPNNLLICRSAIYLLCIIANK